MFTITTMSLDEATVLRASGYRVTTIKKSCSVKALFEFFDSPEIRQLLERYARKELLPIPARTLLITRAELYREARSMRGGL